MVKRWLPLEANPDVMNQFTRGLGVPEDVGFCDVYGLDDEMLAMVPQPVLAVLLLYPQDDKKESDAATTSTVESKEPNKKVYFTKQTICNACGTIGIIHAIGNAVSEIKLVDGSYFHRFYKQTADMDPIQRAAFLEEEWRTLILLLLLLVIQRSSLPCLSSVTPSILMFSPDNQMMFSEFDEPVFLFSKFGLPAVLGVTLLPAKDGVIEHYACFSCVDGELYELDGGKLQPIPHGRSSPDSFLQDAAKVIKARTAEYPGSINFNVMALSKK